MRKALVLSAAAIAAAMTLGAPAAAFAADAAPASAPLAVNSPAKPAQDLRIKLDPAEAQPGATVTVEIDGPALTDATLSSPALTGTQVKGNQATGTVKKDATPGPAQVTVSGTNADGQKVSANATLSVVATPPASKGTLSLNPAEGAAGSKVGLELKLDAGTAPKEVNVLSEAFAGKTVALKKGDGDVWTGSAQVGKDLKSKAYDVSAFSGVNGAAPLAVTSFTVTGTTVPDAPVKAPSTMPAAPVKPVPSEAHVVPKGSVDTGMAPAAASSGTADLTAAGIAAVGGAALLGVTLYTRRRNGA
ncbi:hypothetical protein ACFQ78_41270 [Streptomyces sp. NPDC056519]|uniref:hypothetical protein n=1 Tax=Streptomyces sp. NPDC056519 TaxID=3345849 RepID=UPI0036C3EA1B